jgi:hypothetical protein
MADLRGEEATGLDNVLLDQNYRKNQFPISRLGTKYLTFFSIRLADTSIDGDINQEKLTQIIDIIQNQAELYYVGSPIVSESIGSFLFAVGIDARADWDEDSNYSLSAAQFASRITKILQGRADDLTLEEDGIEYDEKNASAYPPGITVTDGEDEAQDEDILCQHRVFFGITTIVPTPPVS